MKYDFSKTKLRCHYLGDICQSEGKGGGLSAVAKKKLVEVYWEEKYGKRKFMTNKYVSKGKRSEDKAIELIAFNINQHFEKNTQRVYNDYLSGEPDIYSGIHITKADIIIDAKCSYDPASFGENALSDQLNTDYDWQDHGYMDLTGAKKAATAYCLVTDEIEIKKTQDNIFYSEVKWISQESPDWKIEAAKIELAMTYEDIPAEERILIFPIKYDPNKIIRIHNKVLESRDWLSWYQDRLLGFNKTIVTLS